MIRLLVADDHTLFREGVVRILQDARDISVVAQAGSSVETLQGALEHRPDVVLLDVSMPGRGPIETIESLKQSVPGVRVLVLSMYPEDQFAIRLLAAGADGYLTKESAGEHLLAAIRKVHRGTRHVSPRLKEQIVARLGSKSLSRPHEALSNRELQVLQGIAAGKTLTEAARDLNLSVKTVSTYRSRILQKLGLRNNAQLIRYALDEGLVLERAPGSTPDSDPG